MANLIKLGYGHQNQWALPTLLMVMASMALSPQLSALLVLEAGTLFSSEVEVPSTQALLLSV